MQTIALPKKLSFVESGEPNRAKAVLEPLAPGYGTTLGNALRRVLLASLPGVAVIGAKIEGASHEFMALPNVKEDVLEILLNLKKIRFKLDDNLTEARLELKAYGEKKVTAGDIVKQTGVEVVNPELVIADLTDMGGTLNMEIFVRRGLGYETIENREDKKGELGYIDIDSIFSPVLAVGLDIENVRVGKMVNWEKLVLDVETDGTISVQDAFSRATEILLEQFNAVLALSNGSEAVEEPAAVEEAPAEEAVETEEAADEEDTKKSKKK